MPISSTGNRARGVTLMELMVVLAIISLIVAISFPSTMAGLENIRLSSGARSVAAFMNAAANRAERRQQAMELSVSVKDNAITLQSADATYARRLNLPRGVVVDAVLPPLPEPSDEPRHFLFLPGAAPPRMAIEVANPHGLRRIVRLNPITGVTEITQPESP
ncbi:MAG TPA: prepilin-type N-terminal cleavage/methylation domain-containing protein [Bryobacteraceae bacterium]|nr:prepilin-type N-terminal cleavage/methylation domain-containing protein [Bryobacteraceae bacterium]